MSLSDIEALSLKCLRCGHTWLRRISDTPMTCPKCRSAYWNKPRKLKKAAKDL